jgi:hypothetical protein
MPTGSISRRERCGVAPSSTAQRSSLTPIIRRAGVRERLRDLATQAGAKEPVELAERLFVVLEGAYVTGALEGDRGVLERSRAFFVELVEAAVRDRP